MTPHDGNICVYIHIPENENVKVEAIPTAAHRDWVFPKISPTSPNEYRDGMSTKNLFATFSIAIPARGRVISEGHDRLIRRAAN